MFDIGFWELALVGLVSLLVIGPERLPKAARIAGYWIGKSRNMIAAVKAEIKEELQAEEMRQLMQEHSSDINQIHKSLNESKQLLEETKTELDAAVTKTKSLD